MRCRSGLLRVAALVAVVSSAQAADFQSFPAEAEPHYVPSLVTPPALQREFRGAWVATVGNIDWPSRGGLPVEQQQDELRDLLDRAVDLRLNAIILQVRPASDALYASELEPWSHYLSGKMGEAPAPFYDPLEFAVTEAHARGLELHAWFNPFRALSSVKHLAKRTSANHVSRTHPRWVRRYGDLLWLDPGLPEVREHVRGVVLDVVRRYDIDGVHMDDYFYPYQIKDSRGKPVAFPDDASWKRYQSGGGKLSRADWRRDNVDSFVRELYEGIKAEKRCVQFGVSPFGIWRPDPALGIRGLDAFETLYADARKWLEEGWVDYLAPQLYWRIDPPQQSFPVLLNWWAGQNRQGRHLWPGIATQRVGTDREAGEILAQIGMTRASGGSSLGNIHWHMKSLLQNQGDVSVQLQGGLYDDSALVPASPWLGKTEFGELRLAAVGTELRWKMDAEAQIKKWVLQSQRQGKWEVSQFPADKDHVALDPANLPEVIALTAVDRYGNASVPMVYELSRPDGTISAVLPN